MAARVASVVVRSAAGGLAASGCPAREDRRGHVTVRRGSDASDPGAASGPPAAATDGPSAGSRRTIRRARGLPGGRAVVGAFLVAAAALGVFAAYLDAVGAPETRFVVARETVDPGTRIADAEVLAELFELRPIALEGQLAANAVPAGEVEQLLGQLVMVPLAPGDLLLRSGVVSDGGAAGSEQLSFAIDPSAALGGRLRAGERIDVLATYGSGASAWTAYVVRGVPLVQVSGGEGGALGAGPLTLTVALRDPSEVLALTHAVQTADVVVTRSGATEGDRGPLPGPYVPSPSVEEAG